MASEDGPGILGSVAKLATSDACRETVIADGNLFVDKLVGKIIITLGHGADKDADTFVLLERVNIVTHRHHLGIKAEGDLATLGRQVVGDGILDDLEQLFLGGDGANGQAVQELHHQTGEALKGTRNAHRRAHLDEHALGRVDVNLQFAGFVDGRVEEGEQALQHDVLAFPS